MKPALMITGVPGTGKTTIAKLLQEKLGVIHIEVTKFAISEGEIQNTDDKRKTLIVNMKTLSAKLIEVIKESKKKAIIDSHYSPELIQTIFVEKLFVLRRAPWEIKEVLEKRGYSKDKILENIEAEILGTCLHDAFLHHPKEKICEIDNTDRSSSDTAELIVSILEKNNPCEVYEIDWGTQLKTLELLNYLKRTI